MFPTPPPNPIKLHIGIKPTEAPRADLVLLQHFGVWGPSHPPLFAGSGEKTSRCWASVIKMARPLINNKCLAAPVTSKPVTSSKCCKSFPILGPGRFGPQFITNGTVGLKKKSRILNSYIPPLFPAFTHYSKFVVPTTAVQPPDGGSMTRLEFGVFFQ